MEGRLFEYILYFAFIIVLDFLQITDTHCNWMLLSLHSSYVCKYIVSSLKTTFRLENMATNERMKPNTPFRIIFTHGNNGFKSAELLDQMGIPGGNCLEEFKFFPFSDLNNKGSTIQPNSELTSLIEETYQGVEVSAILVLISLTEIFSEGMSTMIQKLPHSKFYRYNQKNEKEWWKHVIIVFSFGEIEKGNNDHVVKSITENGGIKEIVKRSRNRYFWLSDKTEPTELVQKLRDVTKPMKENLILGGTHSPG